MHIRDCCGFVAANSLITGRYVCIFDSKCICANQMNVLCISMHKQTTCTAVSILRFTCSVYVTASRITFSKNTSKTPRLTNGKKKGIFDLYSDFGRCGAAGKTSKKGCMNHRPLTQLSISNRSLFARTHS